MSDGVSSDIAGGNRLEEWLAGTVGFHDAEVLELHLDRAKSSWIRMMTVYRPAIVTFRFEDVVNLELYDFSSQNVISSLSFEGKDSSVRLLSGPCYGISGYTETKHVSVEIAPRA